MMTLDQSKGRILIVDDQEGIRESMAGILEMEGYEIHTFEDGYKAIDKVKEMSFDVAFLDVKMPGINGVDTFRGIKKSSPETVVFMMTAYAEEELVKQALDEGAYACIHKPFDMEKIIEIVESTRQKTAVLIVDNQLNIHDQLRSRLIGKGYKVVSVTSKQEAVQLINRKPVDIVLLDVKGNEESTQILDSIRKITGEENPKVIMINSCRIGEDVCEVVTVGTSKFLGQPADISEVERTVSELLKEKEITGKPSILIVDDDVTSGNQLLMALSKSGYEVKVATTGSKAIEEIKADDSKVILINAKLPDAEGVDIYEQIKKLKPESSVIMMTASSQEEAILNAVKNSSFTFLHKPFDSDSIVDVVRKICEANKNGTGARKPE